MIIVVLFKCVGWSTPSCGTPWSTLYGGVSPLSGISKYSELHAYMPTPRPEYHIAEHKASWYTQSYADVISTNTIATIGFLCAFSNGNDSINVPVFLAEARHLRRVYIAVGPVPVYAIEHNFSISLPMHFRRAIGRYQSTQVGICRNTSVLPFLLYVDISHE